MSNPSDYYQKETTMNHLFERIKKTGKFVLSSGAISGTLFDCSELTAAEVEFLAKKLVFEGWNQEIFSQKFVFVGIAYGGIIFAHELAKQLFRKALILTKQNTVRGFSDCPNVILVDDVVTTGANLYRAKKVLFDKNILAVISLVRRFDIDKKELHLPHCFLYSYPTKTVAQRINPRETVIKANAVHMPLKGKNDC